MALSHAQAKGSRSDLNNLFDQYICCAELNDTQFRTMRQYFCF